MYIKIDNVHTRTENTIRNIVSGLINKVVTLIFPFLVRTVLIKKIGSEYVGMNSLFLSILQVLNVTELGLATAIVYSMYEPVANDNTKEIKKKIQLLKTVYLSIGIIILCIGLIILPFLKFLINDESHININIYFVYLLYLGDVVLNYTVYGYKNSILLVYQRNDLISKTNSLIVGLKSIIQILGILVFKSYYMFVVVIPITTVCSNLIINRITNKIYPELEDDYKLSFNGVSEIKKQVAGIAIGRISLVCRNSFDSIITSSLLGLTTTAIYSNYYLIFSSVSGFLSVMIVSMTAGVGNSLVTESIEKNKQNHIKFDFYYELISGICVICLYSLYQPFMKIWVGKELMFSSVTMTLFCIYFYINHLAQVRSAYSEAAGLWWDFRFLSLAEMIFNLVLNIVLGMIIGVNGILLATIFTAFLSSFLGCSIITYNKLFKCSSVVFFIRNIIYASVTILGCALIKKILGAISIESWTDLFLSSIICFTLAILYMFFFYYLCKYTKKDIISLLEYVRQTIKKFC